MRKSVIGLKRMQQRPVADIFMSHLGGLAALSAPFASFANSLVANAEDLKKQSEVRHTSLDGWRSKYDGHLGPQARSGNRRTI